VPFETSLIGAQEEDEKLAHLGELPIRVQPGSLLRGAGETWWPNWTYDPIIHVTGPGPLAVRCAGKLVVAIERGVLLDATMDVFDSEWLPALFARERELVRAEHAIPSGPDSVADVVDHSAGGAGGTADAPAHHPARPRGASRGQILMVDSASELHGLRLKYPLQSG